MDLNRDTNWVLLEKLELERHGDGIEEEEEEDEEDSHVDVKIAKQSVGLTLLR